MSKDEILSKVVAAIEESIRFYGSDGALRDALELLNKAQRPWVGLTDERIIEEYCKVTPGLEWAIGRLEHAMPFARAIEAALLDRK